MKLLCITDLHGHEPALKKILQATPSADAILLGGDITHFGTASHAERFVIQAQQTCSTVFAVAGNCDSAIIDARLLDLGVSLFGQGRIHSGIGFHGVSAMPPWQGTMYELTEDEIASSLESGRRAVSDAPITVVLSHPPPYRTRLDQTRKGAHVGSRALRDFIDSVATSLVVCGHIHEARGIEVLGATTVVNCGPAFQGHFALVDIHEKVVAELRTVPVDA